MQGLNCLFVATLGQAILRQVTPRVGCQKTLVIALVTPQDVQIIVMRG